MSQEDPSLVVTPIDSRKFLGGAGIVAAHASALGAKASLITVKGHDATGEFASNILGQYDVNVLPILDDSRPTTLKQRFRAEGKTLLRVSHLAQSSINPELQEAIFQQYVTCINSADLVVFSDFNYGCLPNRLIPRLIDVAEQKGVICVADSQCSSQIGDISRFKNMSLVSATEREARISLRDNDAGLTIIADKLMHSSRAKNVMVKLGADGVLLHSSSPDGRIITNQLPAMNHNPVDPAGAGDSMLITTSLALAAGADFWSAATIGSVAAALQVSRLGNQPLQQSEFLENLALI
jgi:rfaE bifunctional protein kinase chain/domain